MTESIFSPLWHKVAGLHPRLRAHVQLERQRLRGETWYLLRDEASGLVKNLVVCQKCSSKLATFMTAKWKQPSKA